MACLQPHAPNLPPTPPYQKRGHNTDDNGKAMLRSLSKNTSKKTSVEDPPVPLLSSKRNRRGFSLSQFYTAAPKCVSIRRLARASHISRPCCEHYDESVGQSASPARPVDIQWRSCSFRPSASVADEKSRRLELPFRRLFLRPTWLNICPRCFSAICFSSLELVC